ncbi:hypothetical protein J2125_002910 [Erwinia toletana]|uniref:MASE1 domain-containing protein n=1 Tax=Winslowiella toletana TaxID=92490 RepID=A0ABS4PAP4_9GAMM|nr:hypothetical protein [Winslowiella toletana]MBP2169718.1 hypothetical protein [Winslowiella toletana]
MKTRMILIGWLAFVCCDFALAMLSLQVRDVWSLSSLVWFPAGLLLGVVCALPVRYWLAWLLSAALMHLVASQLYGRPVNVSLIFCGFDVLLLMVTALIWQFYYGAMYRPSRPRDILALALLCGISGVAERLITTWALFLLDYPIDQSLSLLSMGGYVLSYLPLTFFVLWLVTIGSEPQGDIWLWLLAFGMLLAQLMLFFAPVSSSEELRWQDLALMFSFALPLLLAMRGDLLLLSIFLSLSVVSVVGATLFGQGPFYHPQRNVQQDVLLATWYCAAFSLPALLCASWISQRYAQLARHQWREQLMDTVLQQGWFHRFQLNSAGAISWRYQSRWQDTSHAPAYWSQFIAWLHPEDRQAVEQLKASAPQIPQVLAVRLADVSGQFHRTTMALIACRKGNQLWFEGVLFPDAQTASVRRPS